MTRHGRPSARRRDPRQLGPALDTVLAAAAPATPLARVQGAWADAVGAAVAAESEPVSERDGVVTVACSSGVWAQELELLSEDLLGRLRAAIGEGGRPVRLRFVAGGRPTRA